MLESSLIYIAVRTFPESMILILSGMIFLNKKITLKSVFQLGMILGSVIGCIRYLPINFGVHTILSMISLGILLFILADKDIKNTITSTCLVWIALILSEGIYVFITTFIFKIQLERIMDNSSISGALITIPSLFIMLLLVIIIKKAQQKLSKIGALND